MSNGEVIVGEFNFDAMKGAELDELLSKLLDNFDPEIDSVKRKRIQAAGICRRNKLNNRADVEKYAEQRATTLLKDIPEDYHGLLAEPEKVFPLLKKAGARIQKEMYDLTSRADVLKLIRRLKKRIADDFQGVTLPEFDAMSIAKSRGGRALSIVFDAANLPTLAPNGLWKGAIDVIDALKAKGIEIAQVGRSSGKRALCVVVLKDEQDTRIYIQMPDEYIIDSGDNGDSGDETDS